MNLKELSGILGLSQTTVSRALNGYPEVKEETRRRVVQAAAAHGYQPNSRARSLATGRSFSIGHIVPVSTYPDIVNPVFADFIASAGRTLSRRGYSLSLWIVDDKEQKRAYLDLAAKGTVDGMIVHGLRMGDPRIEWLESIGLPFVVHGSEANRSTTYSWVDVNNKRAFAQATEFLIHLGHKRIALINGDEMMNFAACRRAGYEETMTKYGIALDPSLMSSDNMIESLGYNHARRMALGQNPPTAYLASSLLLAIGVRRALHDLGFELGRDVSVVAHDDELSFLPNCGDIPNFTATRSSIREAGSRCAEILLDLIEGNISNPQNVVCGVDLVVGASTGPLRINSRQPS